MIKESYTFKEVNTLSKQMTLDEKIETSVEVIRQALSLCKHRAAVAFSGGKDSEVVADLIEG